MPGDREFYSIFLENVTILPYTIAKLQVTIATLQVIMALKCTYYVFYISKDILLETLTTYLPTKGKYGFSNASKGLWKITTSPSATSCFHFTKTSVKHTLSYAKKIRHKEAIINTCRLLILLYEGADLGGGCRGCAPLPEMTYGVLIQLVFYKMQKNCCLLLLVTSFLSGAPPPRAANNGRSTDNVWSKIGFVRSFTLVRKNLEFQAWNI